MSANFILALTFLQAFQGFVAALEGNCRLFSYNMVVKFDLHESICCGGTVYIRDRDENGFEKTKCCYGRNSKMYDVETHACCEGAVVTKDACCHGRLYNKERFTCCDGKIKNKMTTPCCGNRPVNPYDGVKCCGGDMYNNIIQTCCNAIIWDGTGECCGDILVENPFSDICCHHNGATRLHMEAYGSNCCGLDTYRPETQLCCKSIVKDKINDTTECCGNTTFDITREVCCQGHVLKSTFGMGCCGGRLYNKDDEVCCKDKIYKKGGRSKCCQDRAYQEEKSLCFNNHVLNESVPHVAGIVQYTRSSSTAYLKTTHFECEGKLMTRNEEKNACCDTTAYNTADYLCCKVSDSSFELVKRQALNHDRCCGRDSFDSNSQGCCYSTELQVYDLENEICNEYGVHPRYGNIKMALQSFLLRKPPKDKLCKIRGSDEVPYNSNTSVCTPRGVVALPEGIDICGNKTFNKDLFICCRGIIFVKNVVDEIHQCCQDPVDKETYIPAIQTCFNGRIINIPEENSGICRGEVYDSRTHGCDIAGKIRSIEEIKEKPSVCWYNETYFHYFNETNERCCNGQIIDAVYTCCAEESDCCNPGDIEGYNQETHVCCGGVLRRLQQPANLQRLTRSMAARSPQLRANDCHGGHCTDFQHKSFLCCQKSLFNDVEGELTCDGNELTGRFRNNTMICRGELCKNGTDCCGNKGYDNETEICCGGVILKKSDNPNNKTCCGNHVFDPSVEGTLCCESSFYENATGLSCCGGATYDVTTETCCTTGGKTYVFPSKDGLCCSDGQHYDDTLHTCCDGLVHKYVTSGTCCGNDVIRDPTREACFNEKVYQI